MLNICDSALQPPGSSVVATTIARSSLLSRSQASVAILCRTSHLAPRMAPTRQSHSTNARARKTVSLDITVISSHYSSPRASATGPGTLLACVCANLIGRIDTRYGSPPMMRRRASDGVGRFATTAALMEAAPTIKPRRQTPRQLHCDITPSLSTGQPEPGNWGCRHVSALPDCKSSREEVPPTEQQDVLFHVTEASPPTSRRAFAQAVRRLVGGFSQESCVSTGSACWCENG